MISKERLEELIKQGATVYEAKYGNINPVNFSKNKVRWVNKSCITLEPSLVERYGNHKYYKNLFETKEDAEWYLEFGNITRTETLSLPTWGMFIQLGIPFEFTSKTGEYFYLEICDIAGTDKIIIYNKIGFISNVFSAPVTKENYLEACKIAKKLFLGENIDEK